MTCYWDKIDSLIGTVYLAATDEGLIYCSTPNGQGEELQNWVGKHLQSYTLQKGTNNIIELAKQQLQDYFGGKSKVLDVPLKFMGTPFQNKAWKALTTIPYGETRTYGQIAMQIGCPKGPRAVGMANNRNSIALFVP